MCAKTLRRHDREPTRAVVRDDDDRDIQHRVTNVVAGDAVRPGLGARHGGAGVPAAVRVAAEPPPELSPVFAAPLASVSSMRFDAASARIRPGTNLGSQPGASAESRQPGASLERRECPSTAEEDEDSRAERDHALRAADVLADLRRPKPGDMKPTRSGDVLVGRLRGEIATQAGNGGVRQPHRGGGVGRLGLNVDNGKRHVVRVRCHALSAGRPLGSRSPPRGLPGARPGTRRQRELARVQAGVPSDDRLDLPVGHDVCEYGRASAERFQASRCDSDDLGVGVSTRMRLEAMLTSYLRLLGGSETV